MSTPSVNPSGRVSWLAHPVESPGQCGVCGKPRHEKGFVFFGMHFEFYGTLILCYDCVGEIAAVFDYIAPENLADLREHMSLQDTELNTLRQAILGLESAVEGLTNFRDLNGNRVGTLGRAVELPPVENTVTQPAPTEPVAPVVSDTPTVGTVEGTTAGTVSTAPTVESGPTDLHSTATADAILGLPTNP